MNEDEFEKALAAGRVAADAMARVPSDVRAQLLVRLRDAVRAGREDFARSICDEAKKPIADSRAEVDRAIQTLTLSAEEAGRIGGETMPLDQTPAGRGRFGITRRFPVGLVGAISPFNFPLNLGMHKVGPALAAGNAVLWKPSLKVPGAARRLAEAFTQARDGLAIPEAALQVIEVPDTLAARLATDPRIDLISFTGSARVGWQLRASAGTKPVLLELGGNAAVAVAADADLDHAVARCVAGAFAYAGQVCISVQRIVVDAALYDAFVARLIERVERLAVGDPADEATFVGPMIAESEAQRLSAWIDEATAGGARVLTGGGRRGALVEPTVLAGVAPTAKLSCEEAFGPVVTVAPFRTWDEALARIDDSPYGLQAGVFTRDLSRALTAFERLRVGAVILNDVPTFRVDSMPYGGVKASGLGREGVRYAVAEMTQERLLVLPAPGP